MATQSYKSLISQAMARIWRDGQKRKVFVYRLLSSNTIEERMYQRQITKQGLSGVVVDLKSTDSRSLPSFSVEQLKELFSPVNTASLCITHDMLSCNCLLQDNLENLEDCGHFDENNKTFSNFIFEPTKVCLFFLIYK